MELCVSKVDHVRYFFTLLQYKYVSTLFAAGLGPLIFGATMLIGGFLTFYLPETNNKKIPVTISEANTFVIRK